MDAIRKEAVVMREEWEKSVCKKDTNSNCNGTVTPTDSYCFEMLSMVSALSGSNVGRSYLADQHDLLSNLLSLLHTGSARVQRQVSITSFRSKLQIGQERLKRIISRIPSDRKFAVYWEPNAILNNNIFIFSYTAECTRFD